MTARGVLSVLVCVAALGCSGDDGASSTDATVSVSADSGDSDTGDDVGTPSASDTEPATDASGTDIGGTEPAGDEGGGDELEDVRIEVPSSDLEVGADDAFVVTSNGTLYWHPELLGEAPQEAVPIARVEDGSEIWRVAGVVDGSVVFGSCCTTRAGEVAAATGEPEPVRLLEGSAPALSPDGTQLAIVGESALTVVDVATGVGQSRLLGSDDDTGVPSDVIWLDDGGPVALVTIDDEYALVRVDPVAVSFGTAVPIGIAATTSRAELAGVGPNGEIAVATSSGDTVELRAFDVDTLEADDSLTRPLPDGVSSVRVTTEGELLWVDGDTLWHTPAGESVPVPLGAGSAAAWFAAAP